MSFIGAIRDAFYALENLENARWMRNKFCRPSSIHAPLKAGGFKAFINNCLFLQNGKFVCGIVAAP